MRVDLNRKFISKFNGFTNRDYLHCAILKLYMALRKKEPTSQETCSFSFKMFKMKFFNGKMKMKMKMFKNSMKFIRAACWINSKISNRDKNITLMVILSLLLVIVMAELLKVFNDVEFYFLKPLKISYSNANCSSSYDPFLLNNCNMTNNSAEK